MKGPSDPALDGSFEGCLRSVYEYTEERLLMATIANVSLPAPFPSVFDRARPGDIRTDPFPHIVLENALDSALCARLVETRLTYESLAGALARRGLGEPSALRHPRARHTSRCRCAERRQARGYRPVAWPTLVTSAGHVVTGNRLFSALYYLRAPDDETTGGGLDLFRHKGPVPDDLDQFELPPEAIETVTTVPFAANTLGPVEI